MPETLTACLREVAAAVLPGVDLSGASVAAGSFHRVVLVPGTAAVRIALGPDAATELPRRTELARRLAPLLPFAVPVPLGEVVTVAGHTAVALSWLDGAGMPAGRGEPAELARLMAALAEVDTAPLAGVLGVPHEYAGRERWAELMTGEVADRLPPGLRARARRRVADVLELPPVPLGLVHGDLAGDNLRWDAAGRLTGVLDWDLAAPWDPAVDAACLAWHGWPAVRAALPPETVRRAVVHHRVFGLEHIARCLLDGAPEPEVAARVERAAAWLERTGEAPAV